MIEWWIPLLVIFGGAMFLLLKGIPVAFAFVIVNMLGVLILQGAARRSTPSPPACTHR